MKKQEIQVGGIYAAKISGRVVPVKVLAIREIAGHVSAGSYHGWTARKVNDVTVYDVENQVTGRKTTFRSAAKFRYAAKIGPKHAAVRAEIPEAIKAAAELDGAEQMQDADFQCEACKGDLPEGCAHCAEMSACVDCGHCSHCGRSNKCESVSKLFRF